MRRIFNSRFDTVTGADGIVTITVAQKTKPQGRFGQSGNGRGNGRNHQTKSRLGWQELGGEHLHFSLYKENKDTMEVIAYISSQLKDQPKAVQFCWYQGQTRSHCPASQRLSSLCRYSRQLEQNTSWLQGRQLPIRRRSP